MITGPEVFLGLGFSFRGKGGCGVAANQKGKIFEELRKGWSLLGIRTVTQLMRNKDGRFWGQKGPGGEGEGTERLDYVPGGQGSNPRGNVNFIRGWRDSEVQENLKIRRGTERKKREGGDREISARLY